MNKNRIGKSNITKTENTSFEISITNLITRSGFRKGKGHCRIDTVKISFVWITKAVKKIV